MDSIIEISEQVNSPDSVSPFGDPLRPEFIEGQGLYFIVDAETDLSQLFDGIYPYNGGEDRWIIVINCQPIGWASEWGKAVIQEIEALQTQREHAQRCPQDADDYGLQEPTL